MEPAALQQLLRDGIAAIKSGDRTRGRDLLLKVVEADERIEPAWLWLSAAVDDPNDQLTALDNVLALNPHNAAAAERARQLREQLGLAPPPAVQAPAIQAPEPESVPPEALPEAITYQCVYCGQPTRETDQRCPHCHRNLMVMGQWQGKGFQYVILILSGLYAQLTLVELVGAAINLSLSYGLDPLLPNLLSKLPYVPTVLGEFVIRSRAEAINVILAAGVRAVVTLVVLLLFYTDVGSAYAIAIWILLADVGWNWLAVTQLGWLTADTARLNSGFAALMMGICLLAALNRRGARKREFVEIDRTLTNALALYVRGRDLAHAGKWAAAAAHWSKAAALKPSEAAYAKDLALALARLGRTEEAIAALERGQQHHPDDAQFKTLLATIKRAADG